MESSTTIIEQLRAHIESIAPMRNTTNHASTGWSQLDACVGGWPQPGVVSIHGAVGTGRMGVVLPAMRAFTQNNQTVALVDPLSWVHPPGLTGVNLKHFMLVRCGSPRAGWAAQQLASSGALPLVVILDPPRLARDAFRLIRAAEQGSSTVVVLTERPDPDLTAAIRIQTLGSKRIRIERGAIGTPCLRLT